MQKYPRGSRGSPAKGVVWENRSAGSNPAFCAKKRQVSPVVFLYAEGGRKGSANYRGFARGASANERCENRAKITGATMLSPKARIPPSKSREFKSASKIENVI